METDNLKPDEEMIPHIGRKKKGEFAPAARLGPGNRSGAGAFLLPTCEMVETSGFACAKSRAPMMAAAPGLAVQDAFGFPGCRSVMKVDWMGKGFPTGRREVSADHSRVERNPKAGFGGPVKCQTVTVIPRTDRVHLIDNAMVSKFETSPAAGEDPGG